MAKTILTLEDRFMQWVEPEPTSGCWLWTARVNRYGYGRFQVKSGDGIWKQESASRVSWALFCGAIPDGAHILHRCDVRSCVNPGHLFLGDNRANCIDRARKNRGVTSKSGLPFGAYRLKRSALFGARVRFQGKLHLLGNFDTAEEASITATAFKKLAYSRLEEPLEIEA